MKNPDSNNNSLRISIPNLMNPQSPSTPQSPRDVAPMPIYSFPPPEQIFSTLLSKKDPEQLTSQDFGPSDDNRGYQAFPKEPSHIFDLRLPDDIPRGSIGEGRW